MGHYPVDFVQRFGCVMLSVVSCAVNGYQNISSNAKGRRGRKGQNVCEVIVLKELAIGLKHVAIIAKEKMERAECFAFISGTLLQPGPYGMAVAQAKSGVLKLE
jgi:hypothetical protein